MPDYMNPLALMMSLYLMSNLVTPTFDNIYKLPQSKPILLDPNRNIYEINNKRYDISKYKNKLFDLYLAETNPINSEDYIDDDSDIEDWYNTFDPVAYRLQLMQISQTNAYNQASQNVLNSATTPDGSIAAVLPSTAKPPLKLPDITKMDVILDAGSNNIDYLGETKVPSSFNEKFSNSTFGKNSDGWSAGLDSVANIGAMFSRGQSTYNGPKGNIRAGIDQGWNSIADAASKLGPYGKLVSLGMKGINAVNNITGAIFGATDGMTTVDSVFDSPIGTLTGLGWINQATGRRANTIHKNEDVFAQLGSAYSGTDNAIDNALKFSGKKYGGFSTGARHDVNEMITDRDIQQDIAEYIADNAMTRSNLVTGMSSIVGNARNFDMLGGYKLSAYRRGRNGMKIVQRTKSIVSKHLKGGSIEIISEEPVSLSDIREVSLKDIPRNHFEPITLKEVTLELIPAKYKEGGKIPEEDYTWTIDYAKSKDLNWIKRWLDPNRATIPDWKDKSLVATHKLSVDSGEFDGITKYYVYPEVLEINGQLFDFTDPKNEKTPEDAYNNAFDNRELLLFDDKDAAIWFTQHYKEYAPFKYKEGGKFNVIPEGALHARLHHMENAEDLTKKGIPVVSEGEDGKLELQAEIECDEIIFRISVTEKLEELEKKYSDEEISQKDKDECAIEAGKLLVKEILYNTQDNTNLINNTK